MLVGNFAGVLCPLEETNPKRGSSWFIWDSPSLGNILCQLEGLFITIRFMQLTKFNDNRIFKLQDVL